MKHVIGLFLIPLILASCTRETGQRMDLSGEWTVKLDRNDEGVNGRWYLTRFAEKLILPGSLAGNGMGDAITASTVWTSDMVDSSWYTADKYAPYREEGNIKIPFWLQPEKRYVGAAWYQKEIEVPRNWVNKHLELYLERPHWETRVWIDDREIGLRNSLGTPHSYSLDTPLNPGKHRISIRVDNRIKDINPGVNAHSIGDHTQSNWNGVAGELSIRAFPMVCIESVRLFPDVEAREVNAQICIRNFSGKAQPCILILRSESEGRGEKLKKLEHEFNLQEGEEKKTIDLSYPMGPSPALWDEFNPSLYRMNLELHSPEGIHKKSLLFGLREFTARGKRFAINGRPLFLRGTLECCIFPETGYPPTDMESWEKIFTQARAHGLNHIRFHSWCPPEAAFNAADRLGIYLQVECSSWVNSGPTLGDGQPIDAWLYEEAEHILEAYGNHPSFCLMTHGNEPGGANQTAYLDKFVRYFKEKDPRHVYTAGSGWPYLEAADYFSDSNARIQRWGEGIGSIINKYPPQTSFDYRNIVEPVPMPYVSHEIGQWCVYPDFKEIPEYKGILKPRNFEIFRETLEQHGIGPLADSFLLASGKLQALCYKADIEAALRTPGIAGFQLLDLHDFPGQGTALVGVLNPFWEEKGYITPGEYSRFCNETVPLVRMQKLIFSNRDTFEAIVEVAHFGPEKLPDPEIRWKLSSRNGDLVAEGRFEMKELLLNNNQVAGTIRAGLDQVAAPEKLILEVSVNQFSNSWELWVFPGELPEVNDPDILVTSQLDRAAMDMLEKGGKVLWSLPAHSLSEAYGGNIALGFSSIFWNTSWTRGQAPHTLGILCDPGHPALAGFPSEYHSNWQWWDAMNHGQAIVLDRYEDRIDPIVRVIDDWFENRSLGLIFEARAGEGKIIVCGADLFSGRENRPEARQLLHSLESYMASPRFQPKSRVSVRELEQMTKNPASP
jgi:hypothetical protein